MATLTEQLKWLITADASQAVKQFQSVGKAAEKELGGAQKKIDTFGSSFLKAGAGMASSGLVIGASLVKAANSFRSAAGEATKFSAATGIGVESSSRLIVVANNMKIEADTLAASLGKMNATLGTSPSKFDKLGISIARNKDGTEDVLGTFENVIDVLGRMRSADDRAAAGKEIFGRGWANVSKLIVKGTDDINKAMASVDAGQVITPEEAAQAKEYKEAVVSLGNAMKGLTISIGQGAAPILADLADIVSAGVRAFSGLDAITGGFVGKAAAIGAVGLVLAGTASVIVGTAIKMRASIAGTLESLGLRTSAVTADAAATTADTAAITANTAALETNAGAAEADAVAMGTAATAAEGAAAAQGTFTATATSGALGIGLLVGGAGLIASEYLIAKGRTEELTKATLELSKATSTTATFDEMTAGLKRFLGASLGAGNQFELIKKFAEQDPAGAKRLSEAIHSGAIEFKASDEFGKKYVKTLDDAVAKSEAATTATEDGTTATIASVQAAEDQAKALEAVGKAQAKLTDAFAKDDLDKETKAFEAQTKALQAHKTALEKDADAQTAIAESTKASGDAVWDAADKTDAYHESVSGLKKAVSDAGKDHDKLAKVYRDNARAADEMSTANVESARTLYGAQGVTLSAAQGTDIWNDSMLRSIGTLKGPARQAITDHIELVNGVPEDRTTEFEALVKSGDLAGAKQLLDDVGITRSAEIAAETDKAAAAQTQSELDQVAADREAKIIAESNAAEIRNELDLATELRNAEIMANVDHTNADRIIAGLTKQRDLFIRAQVFSTGADFYVPGAVPGGNTGGNSNTGPKKATGGQLSAGQPVLVGDGPGGVMTPWSELFVPSTDGTLYSNPKTRDIMRGAHIPSHASGAGGQQLSAAQLILLGNAGASFESPTSSADAVKEQDRLQAAMYKTGRISLAAYRDYAKGRLAASQDLSDDWLAQYDLIASLNDQEEQARKQQIAGQDELQKALVETGAISQQAYEDYLKGRLGSYQAYSSDWLSIWKEIKDLNEQQVKEAEDNAQRMSDAAKKAIHDAYDTAQAAKELSDAQARQGEADYKVIEAANEGAGVQRDRKATAADKAEAVQKLVDAENSAADAAYRTILAGAQAEGLEVGTVEWDRYMRRVIQAAADAYANRGWDVTSAAILGNLTGIPNLAAGGIVRARPGGTLVRAGEAGRDEMITPLPIGAGATTTDLQRMADAFAASFASVLGSVTFVVEGTPLTAVVQRASQMTAATIKAGKR